MTKQVSHNSVKKVAEDVSSSDSSKNPSILDGRFTMMRGFHLADCLTIGNGMCGTLSIFNSANYLITGQRGFLWIALVLPAFGFFFDAMDGKVARWRKTSSMLGQELDSLADLVSLISFGVAPAFLAFTLGMRSFLDTLALSFFVACGLARLARFNATVALIPKDETGKSKYFEGMPIPTSLALVATMSYWVQHGLVGNSLPLGVITLWGQPGGHGDVHKIVGIFVVWAAAMVSKTLKIPKY